MILDLPGSPSVASPTDTSAVVSPSVASSVPDFLDYSPSAVVATIVSFLDHRTRLNLPSKLTTDPMATRALDSDVDQEFLNFVFCEATEAEFQRFLGSARPVHVNLTLSRFDAADRANDRLAQLLGRAKLGLRSVCLSGSWQTSVIELLHDKISHCRKFVLRDTLIDSELTLFPPCMPFLRQLVLDNVVLVCDRKYFDDLVLPTLPRLESLHLAVRPVCFTLQALAKMRAERLTVKYVSNPIDILRVSQILTSEFPMLRALKIDSLSLCDLHEKLRSIEHLSVGSAAVVDDHVFNCDNFSSENLKSLKLRMQAPNPAMIRKFFSIFRTSDGLQSLSLAWNTDEDFLEDLVRFRVTLKHFRFAISPNGMGLEAERVKSAPVRTFSEEFDPLLKCRCLQCRLQELPEHSRLISENFELSVEAKIFYQIV